MRKFLVFAAVAAVAACGDKKAETDTTTVAPTMAPVMDSTMIKDSMMRDSMRRDSMMRDSIMRDSMAKMGKKPPV